MRKRIASLATGVVLAVALAVFTGAALAGNGSGGGGTQATSPGNSANAPGQVKKQSSTTTASTQSSQGGADANANASVAGVKPTSSTAHGKKNTSCTTGGGGGTSATCSSSVATAATVQAAAHKDASKRYGSGTTAAQIANSNGAPAGTMLSGPGNSQPHKVTDCKHKHAVDVHAVKSYSSAQCVSSTATTTHVVVTASSTQGAVVAGGSAAASTPAVTGVTPSGVTTHGGVKGAIGKTGPAGGVLGKIEAVGHGVLPFTGFPLGIAAAAGLGLFGLGLALRRHARMTV